MSIINSIWSDIKRELQDGNMVMRLIAINVMVFFAMGILALFSSPSDVGELPSFYDKVILFFSFSTDWWHNITHPWVLFTHQFIHENIFHLLFNMLLFYYFGKIAPEFLGNNRILPLYLLAGIVGAFVYFILGNIMYANELHYANGASAAVMGIVIAAVTAFPKYTLNLVLFGPIKIIYIAAFLIVIDIIGIIQINQVNVRFTHIGGALLGWFLINQLRKGNDIALYLNQIGSRLYTFFFKVFVPKNSKAYYQKTAQQEEEVYQKPPTDSPYEHLSQQEQIDAILDKIKLQGYNNLNAEEKEILFKASKK